MTNSVSNNTLKKFLIPFSILFFSLGWSLTILASSYETYFYLEHELQGPTRYFDGQNIAFEATPETYPRRENPKAQPENSFYEVTLVREINWFDKVKIGTAKLPRNSFGKAVWTNVGPGNYYLFFNKAKDRMVVTDDNARMYNF